MKQRLFFLFFIFNSYAFAQPAGVQLIEHTYYKSWFSTNYHIPIIIEYELKRSMVECSGKLKRTNKFAKDPDFPEFTDLKKDYKYSGYDQGHNMPAADNACSETGMKECFYFSNMTPQPHSFNAGVWKSLETKERSYALEEDIKVFTGSIGVLEKIGEDSVVVPAYMWKLIYFPKRASNKYNCYLFPNTSAAKAPLADYQISLSALENCVDVQFSKGKLIF